MPHCRANAGALEAAGFKRRDYFLLVLSGLAGAAAVVRFDDGAGGLLDDG
jgi:hypothetical protein